MLASRLHGVEDIRLDTVDDPHTRRGRGAGQGRAQRHLRQRSPHVLPREPVAQRESHHAGPRVLRCGRRARLRSVRGRARDPGRGASVLQVRACARCTRGLEHLCVPMKVLGLRRRGRRARRVLRDGRRHGVRLARRRHARAGRARRADGGVVQRRAARRRRTRHARRSCSAPGPIGIGVLLGLRAKGIDDVVVVEPSAKRREAIAALGATDVLDPDDRRRARRW